MTSDCVGTVCRFKPVHLGHAAMLEELCGSWEQVRIGVGSSNRYDLRNPFTFAETAGMIDALLRPRFSNYTLTPVPDLGHGPRWRAQVQRLLGPLDAFVTANDYVAGLLGGTYPLYDPRDVIPVWRHVPVTGTRVRVAMALGEPWEELVPERVAEFLTAHGLPRRFRREFGLATLSHELSAGPRLPAKQHNPQEVNDVCMGR